MQQPQHTTPLMSDALKLFLAEKVYETIRGTLIMTAPDMKTWADLNDKERAQCMNAMWFWIAGLGSNEVGHEWYNRSGQIPRAIWGQLPGFEHETVFTMAGLDLLIRLIGLGEQSVRLQQERQPLTHTELWKALNAGEHLRVGHATLHRARGRDLTLGAYIVTYGERQWPCVSFDEALIVMLTLLGDIQKRQEQTS